MSESVTSLVLNVTVSQILEHVFVLQDLRTALSSIPSVQAINPKQLEYCLKVSSFLTFSVIISVKPNEYLVRTVSPLCCLFLTNENLKSIKGHSGVIAVTHFGGEGRLVWIIFLLVFKKKVHIMNKHYLIVFWQQ